jgi:hypothetical protein
MIEPLLLFALALAAAALLDLELFEDVRLLLSPLPFECSERVSSSDVGTAIGIGIGIAADDVVEEE